MIVLAAVPQPSADNAAIAVGTAAIIRVSGRRWPITPVENGSTCSGAQFNANATAAVVARASSRPPLPVAAFALHALTSHARNDDAALRSEERRVGKEWGSTCRSRWSP